MRAILPQECEVWYLLPVLRKELAHCLKNDYKLSQRKVASLLGVTEAAVSQYMHDKRALEIEASDKVKEILDDAARRLHEGTPFMEMSLELCRNKDIIRMKCELHQRVDPNISKDCDICLR